MSDLRNGTEGHEELPQSFVLACSVGEVIEVRNSDLPRVQDGKYDQLGEHRVWHFKDGHYFCQVFYRLRRVE
jgi:hypothetical protein